jgi:hypothetical protein
MGGLFKQGLELGEKVFDGVEVGGVSRQMAQAGAGSFDSLLDACHFMTGQVVGDNDIARLERGAQEVAHIAAEGRAIHGTVEHHGGGERLDPQAGDEGGALPLSTWHSRYAALALGSTAMGASHVGRHAGFIQKHQFGDIKRGLAFPPLLPCGLYVGTFLLAGVQSFF